MKAPPMNDQRPPETMVLFGEDPTLWTDVLPLLNPIFCWINEEGLVLVRWEMSSEVATKMGLDRDVKCSEPGCNCGRMLEYDGGLLVDTNWRQTGWFFNEMA